MTYDISKEIKELAALLNASESYVVEMLNDKNIRESNIIGEDWHAWNRGAEAKVKRALSEEQAKSQKTKIRKERLAGYRWVKEEGEWVVAGDMTDKEIGDDLIVTKASGERQIKRIYLFTSTGNAYVE